MQSMLQDPDTEYEVHNSEGLVKGWVMYRDEAVAAIKAIQDSRGKIMEAVPQDVINKANELQNLFGDGKQGYVAFDIAVFAITDERSRCKQLCDGLEVALKIYPSESAKSFYLEGVKDAASAISKAIDVPGTSIVEFGLEEDND